MTQLSGLLQTRSLAILGVMIGALVLIALLRKFVWRHSPDIFSMWSNTRMVVFTAVTGALYVAVMIPFKWAVILPGLSEVRPGVALPMFLAFLFGPAAAWGSGIGNFIGDFFGTIGPGSIFGFFGNFLLAYAPYAFYRAWMGHAAPLQSGWKGVVVLIVALLVGVLACATVISWGLNILGYLPFIFLGATIAVNDTLFALALVLPLLAYLQPRMEKWGVAYYEVMDPEQARPARTAKIGSLLLALGAAGGWLIGMGMFFFDFSPRAETIPDDRALIETLDGFFQAEQARRPQLASPTRDEIAAVVAGVRRFAPTGRPEWTDQDIEVVIQQIAAEMPAGENTAELTQAMRGAIAGAKTGLAARASAGSVGWSVAPALLLMLIGILLL